MGFRLKNVNLEIRQIIWYIFGYQGDEDNGA